MPEFLPPMIERNLRAQALLPAQRPLVEFFARSLARFQDSSAKFEVICTIPPPSHPRPSAVSRFLDGASPFPAPIPPRTRPKTLVVLDSSFNPPTTAHLRMATSAIEDLRKASAKGQDNAGEKRPSLRLLLLLAINNADKAPKPASFEQRLAMMWAFAKDIQHLLSDDQREKGAAEKPEQGTENDDGIAIDVALSTQPYFTDKSAAIAEADFYLGEDKDTGKPSEQIILAGYDTLVRIFNPKYYGAPDGSPVTPIQRALGPFFDRAKLRVTMRTDDEWGGKEEQLAYLESLVKGDTLESIGGLRDWGKRVEMVEGRAEGEEIVSSTMAREAAQEADWERLARFVTPELKKWIETAELYVENS